MQRPDNPNLPALQENVSSLLSSLMFLFNEPFDPVRLSKLPEFKTFLLKNDIDLIESLTNFKAFAVNRTEDLLSAGKTNRKRKRLDSSIYLKNMYTLLADKSNDSIEREIPNSNEGDAAGGSASPPPKKYSHSISK